MACGFSRNLKSSPNDKSLRTFALPTVLRYMQHCKFALLPLYMYIYTKEQPMLQGEGTSQSLYRLFILNTAYYSGLKVD